MPFDSFQECFHLLFNQDFFPSSLCTASELVVLLAGSLISSQIFWPLSCSSWEHPRLRPLFGWSTNWLSSQTLSALWGQQRLHGPHVLVLVLTCSVTSGSLWLFYVQSNQFITGGLHILFFLKWIKTLRCLITFWWNCTWSTTVVGADKCSYFGIL